MRKNLIDLFFLELSKETNSPTEIILTGAAAGVLYGHVRMSLDLDFEIRPKAKNEEYLLYLYDLVKKVSARMGVEVNYSEDIGHWSMIDFLEYRDKAVPYKKMGYLDIKLMAPKYWTIGKIARFLEMDTSDVVHVIKKKKIDPDELIRLWARAFKASQLSLMKKQFLDHVSFFIKTYGKRAWGKKFEPDKAVAQFRILAGL